MISVGMTFPLARVMAQSVECQSKEISSFTFSRCLTTFLSFIDKLKMTSQMRFNFSRNKIKMSQSSVYCLVWKCLYALLHLLGCFLCQKGIRTKTPFYSWVSKTHRAYCQMKHQVWCGFFYRRWGKVIEILFPVDERCRWGDFCSLVPPTFCNWLLSQFKWVGRWLRNISAKTIDLTIIETPKSAISYSGGQLQIDRKSSVHPIWAILPAGIGPIFGIGHHESYYIL